MQSPGTCSGRGGGGGETEVRGHKYQIQSPEICSLGGDGGNRTEWGVGGGG